MSGQTAISQVSILSRKSLRDFRGFTLVELLVVIAIIGILSTILLLQLGTARAKARDTKRISDLAALRSAVELFYDSQATSAYPTALTTANIGKYLQTAVVPTPTSPYGTSVAADQVYGYAYNPNATPSKYHLWVELEQNNASLNTDMDLDSTGWSGDARDYNDAADEACASSTTTDCIYDLGQNQ